MKAIHTPALVLALVLALASGPATADEVWHETPAGRDLVQLPSLAPLVEKVEGAVLTITVEGTANASANEPFFRGFGFGFPAPDMPTKGQGTGFLIHEDGFALTNHHVIENADTIKVRLGSTQEWYDARVIGTDPKTDVALIKLEGNRRDWPYIPLGDSDRLGIGDFVVAVGNPFGLSQTVSMGIISANHRRDIMPSGRQGLYDFLQTDAAINPGNSGGPLINLRGEVVGINAAVNRAGQGLGFAIPINLVKKLVPQLQSSGSVSRSLIGIAIREVTPELAKGFGLEAPRGALVAQVVEDGPAAEAGIEPGDIVTTFDGKPIGDHSDLPLLAAHAGVGKKVKVDVLRDGRRKTLNVKLGELPKGDGPVHPHLRQGQGEAADAGKLGIKVQSLDDEMRRRLDLRSGARGAVVIGVQPGSPAADAGLRPGDLIIKANGKQVGSARDFVKAAGKVQSGRVVKMLVRRGGSTIFLAVVKP